MPAEENRINMHQQCWHPDPSFSSENLSQPSHLHLTFSFSTLAPWDSGDENWPGKPSLLTNIIKTQKTIGCCTSSIFHSTISIFNRSHTTTWCPMSMGSGVSSCPGSLGSLGSLASSTLSWCPRRKITSPDLQTIAA